MHQLYLDESILTINDVIDEVFHELSVKIDVCPVAKKKVQICGKLEPLSSTDLAMLQTAKAMEYVLVTDDQKLIKAAHQNHVPAIDTPHFIHLLVIDAKLPEEKALAMLNQLKTIYNREYVINKVIKDIAKWK
jgi:hypothetical protein